MEGSCPCTRVQAMKPLKIIGIAAAAAIVVAYVLVVAYGAADTHYRCDGELGGESAAAPTTIVLRHREYHPWLKRWNDSDGAFWLEIPERAVEYYAHSTRMDGVIRIQDAAGALRGHFVAADHTLLLSVTEHGTFAGACTLVDR